MKKFLCILLAGLLLVGCSTVASSSSPENTSASGIVSSRPVSKPLPVSSTPTSSAVSSAAPTWEDTYDPAMGWEFNRYENVNVNADLSVLAGQTIRQIATTVDVTYLLTEDGAVYGIGINRHKQLGQNTFQYLYGLQKVDLPEPIKLLSTGTKGCIAVGVSNTLYMWGRVIDRSFEAPDGSEWIDSRGTDVLTIPFDQEVVQVAFQLLKVTLLTADGSVYAFGESYETGCVTECGGMDGYYWRVQELLTPQKVVLPEKITQIDATENAMFWVGESGAVYTAFKSDFIGFPCEKIPENEYVRKLTLDFPVASVTAGLNNLILQSTDRKLYALGCNWPAIFPIRAADQQNRMDGYGFWNFRTAVPLQISFPVKQIQAMTGHATFFLMSDDGDVYALGEGFWDWLLTDAPGEKDPVDLYICYTTPAKMNLPKVSEFLARGNTYFFRSAADGKIYTAGYNMYGTAIGAQRSLDGESRLQVTPAEVPLTFGPEFRLVPDLSIQ